MTIEKQSLPPLCCATAGSVDDGKSTLIGRLLLDAKALYVDQLDHLTEWSHRRGLAGRDLALVTDGLRAEREQGITIDVAWRYFATATRRFILADAPGHLQYTRNAATAASHADVAVIVVDASKGMSDQTRRHLFVARLLGVPAVTIAVNKMDQVGYAHGVFARIRDEAADYLAAISLPRAAADVTCIPISALQGDNVVHASTAIPWYDGPTLLAHLEGVPARRDATAAPTRFPVQTVLRLGGYRGYAGRIASGAVRPGDRVRVWPAGISTTIASVETADGPLDEAPAGRSVTVRLADELDVGRGDLLAQDIEPHPSSRRDFTADVVWMHASPAALRAPYVLKVVTREVRARIESVEATYDVRTATEGAPREELRMNDVARVRVKTMDPVVVDPYALLRTTGSCLFVDPATGDTLGVGMVRE